MSIATLDQYIAAAKQKIRMSKSTARTSVANTNFSVFDLAGQPGAGTLAGTSTANGVVPTDDTAGCPVINAFGGGAIGYVTGLDVGSSVASRVKLYDMLFKAGAYAFTGATTNLSAQPPISGRCPDYPGSGTVFGNGTEIWIEVSTAFSTGTAWQVSITYTNSAGTGSRTTGNSTAQNAASLTLGKMFQMPLQAGDSGVQKIDSVVVTNGGTAMTAGAFNVLILRPIKDTRIPAINTTVEKNILDIGAPRIYEDSALIMTVQADSTSTGTPDIMLEISNA